MDPNTVHRRETDSTSILFFFSQFYGKNQNQEYPTAAILFAVYISYPYKNVRFLHLNKLFKRGHVNGLS